MADHAVPLTKSFDHCIRRIFYTLLIKYAIIHLVLGVNAMGIIHKALQWRLSTRVETPANTLSADHWQF